jgi:hypothetical protein
MNILGLPKFLMLNMIRHLQTLGDVIKACENLHVEEQHELEILLQNYEHLSDGTLREFNMEKASISLKLMDPDCKLVHACACTVP